MAKQVFRMSGKLYRPQPVDDDGEAQWANRRSLKPGDTLQSAGFHSGVKGWQITASGNAEFCNVVVRGYIAVGGAAADVNNGGVTISGVKLSDGTVTAAKLVAATITANEIAAHTITATQIAANTITAGEIAAGTITATQMTVATLSAISADLGTITAGTVTGATVRTAALGARVVLDATGIKQYDATTQRAELLNDGSGWLGASNQFRWTTAGVVELNGAAILPASVTDGKLNVYNVPTISGLVVTDHSPTAAYVSWSAFSLTLNGTSYAIAAGNSNLKYLYWVKPNLTLTGSATCPAMAANLAMVLYNNAGVGVPSLFQNFVYADYISVANLAAINADLGSITAGTITGGTIRTAATGARIELTSTLLAGYAANGTTKEFYLQATDGKAYAGGGNVVLDSGGLKLAYSTSWVDACNVSWVSGSTIKAAIGTLEAAGVSMLRAWNFYSASVYGAVFFSTTSTTASSELRAVQGAAQASLTCLADATGAKVKATNASAHSQYGWGDYVLVRDEKTQNTVGGTAVGDGAFHARDLNTEVVDLSGIASVASNQITLAAGRYRCFISAPAAGAVYRHRIALYNVTDTAYIAYGSSEYCEAGHQNRSFLSYQFTLAAQKVLEVRHRVEATVTSVGFGVASNFTAEVYTVAEFWRDY